MSISVDHFFNHEDELQALARKVNGWIGCFLSPYEGNPEDLFWRFLGMELSLSKHSFENDGELNFEDYVYCLSIRTPMPDADLRRIQIPAMVLIAYALYYRMNLKGILVYDMQHLLARYEDRLDLKGSGTDEMFDGVSGEFVIFPRHLENLSNRLHKMQLKNGDEA
jgi:hypothetical protein